MANFLFNIRMKIQRFMRGRYGMDDLNRYLLYTVIAMDIIGLFVRNAFFSMICNILLILMVFRALSKNYVKRSIENRKFMESTVGIRRQLKAALSSLRDRNYRYYTCPNCRQIVRVPRGRGKIMITCPKCRSEFVKRS